MTGDARPGGEAGMEAFERRTLVAADVAVLKRATDFLTEGLPAGFGALRSRIELAVEELFLNVHKYAYGPGAGPAGLSRRLIFFDGRPCLIIKFQDWGKPFNPFTDAAKPSLSAPLEESADGGLGIHLTRSLSDHASYTRTLGSNVTEIYFFQDQDEAVLTAGGR